MQFNHDNMIGVHLAVDLVNLAGGRGWSLPGLSAVLRQHDFRHPELDEQRSAELHRWAQRLRGAFTAPDVQARCENLNSLLADGAQQAYLSTHDGLRPHMHFAPDEEDITGRVKAVTAGGLAVFTVEAAGRRLGACARETCEEVFVDTSRNGTRSYCCARCGNTVAVRRHRAR